MTGGNLKLHLSQCSYNRSLLSSITGLDQQVGQLTEKERQLNQKVILKSNT